MSAAIPAHGPNCFGCGPENAAGLALELRGEGGAVSGTIRLDSRHEGAPGLAHGGAIAAILDDAAGRLMFLTRRLAVTRRLEVDYLRRVEIDVELEVSARVEARDERGLRVEATLADGDGAALARARAALSFVDPQHFVRADGAPVPEHLRGGGPQVPAGEER